MATERLIIELDAKTSELDAKLRATERRLDELDGTTQKADKSLASFAKTAKVAGGVVVALAASLGARAFIAYADELQKAENQLRSVTSSTEQFVAVQEELRQIANETRQSMTDLTSVYARFKRAGEEAGFTIRETLDLTESLTKAFKIEGNTTEETNSVLLQLTQSFRSGVIAGEEFKAVSEGSTIVLRALAGQLRVTTGQLKDMAAQGLVTPQALIAGLEGARSEINNKFAELEPTFAEVGTAMGAVFTAAYEKSIAESAVGSLKQFLLDGAKEIQREFSGNETQGESYLVRELEIASGRVLELRKEFSALTEAEKEHSFTADRLAIATEKMIELEERLRAVREPNATEIFIDEGTEDPRIQREKDFAAAVLEIQNESLGTLEERFEYEAEIHKLALDNKLINEREYQKSVEASAKKYSDAKEFELKEDKKTTSQKFKNAEGFVNAAQALNSALFGDNKAIAAGLIVADTAAAVMKSLSINPYDYANVAIIVATGIAQLSNALSASKGGGSTSGSSGGSSSPQQESFNPEQSSIGLDFRSENAQTSNVITFNTETGDELIDALAGMLNKNMRQGRG